MTLAFTRLQRSSHLWCLDSIWSADSKYLIETCVKILFRASEKPRFLISDWYTLQSGLQHAESDVLTLLDPCAFCWVIEVIQAV